ncbi:hypothetical protein AN958_10552 [Leucoagaricus sp. SymC.cos]|nr:hypothetical protein AN958_10552 [Leucoagaricus sp. SymC.cos]
MLLFSLPHAHHARYTIAALRAAPSSSHYLIRLIQTTPSGPENISNLTQGHVTNPENVHLQDVQSQSVRGGFKASKDETNGSIDAANECGKAGEEKRPDDMGKGNPERVGFVEQVGGASASARKFEKEKK